MAVGAWGDDGDGGSYRGAVYVLFLKSDGTVKGQQKISSIAGGLSALADYDEFGTSVAPLGDLDADGVGADVQAVSPKARLHAPRSRSPRRISSRAAPQLRRAAAPIEPALQPR